MITYKDAGVNIEEGYKSVKLIKEYAQRTMSEYVLNGLGSFAGMVELPGGYKKPVLVSGTDGVGTKLELAFKTKKYDTVGIDCVAMCVNDILCHGAKPLFFLDYIACGKLEAEVAADLVKGVSDGCVMSECALVGGETAEMPGFYKEGEYDIAGFAVGIVDKDKIINGKNIKPGDKLIGIASSGVHSNGFSLVRKLYTDLNEEFKEVGDNHLDLVISKVFSSDEEPVENKLYEDFLFLDTMQQDKIQLFAKLLQEKGIRLGRVAVRTENNISWKLKDLMDEVEEEFQYFLLRDQLFEIVTHPDKERLDADPEYLKRMSLVYAMLEDSNTKMDDLKAAYMLLTKTEETSS